jgi:hypothetical protein
MNGTVHHNQFEPAHEAQLRRGNGGPSVRNARAMGMTLISGPVESATIGNIAIQPATLAGEYTERVGVTSTAVAEFAQLLGEMPIASMVRAPSSARQPERIDSSPRTERVTG